jgi:hypothetical protein
MGKVRAAVLWKRQRAGLKHQAPKKPFNLSLRLTSPAGNCYPVPLRFGIHVLTH